MYNPTDEDYALLDQTNIEYYMKIDVLNSDGTILDTLDGIVQYGNESISATSDVRRTASITMVPLDNGMTLSDGTSKPKLDLSERSNIWIDKRAILSIGIKSMRTDFVKYYRLGTFVFTDTSISYDATTNQMSVNMSDLMVMLDGTVNGTVGQLKTVIPAYTENESGEPIEYYKIRNSLLRTVTQLANIDNAMIGDMGEFKGMPQYNNNYQTYRATHPLWDNVPYDLEFSSGCTVKDIVVKLRDLYPNYESYFDENGTFITKMIPSCYYDDIAINNDILQRYLIPPEDTTRDLSTIRNVTEIWGQVLDVDYYSENVSNTNNVYTCSIEGLTEKYYSGDKVGLKVPATNASGQKININGFGDLEIYDENTEQLLAPNTLEAGKTYVFQCKNLRTSAKTQEMKFYLLGAYQVHALSVLSDGTVVPNGWTDPDTKTVYNKYSKEYFQKKYNCDTVDITVVADSPFTVQRIGERLNVPNDDGISDISSDSLALARAHYENWKTCRLTDNITINTLLMPWLDVNEKVEYRPRNADVPSQYIIKEVSHDFDKMQSSITLMTFYPLYENQITIGGSGDRIVFTGTQSFISYNYNNDSKNNVVATHSLSVGDYVWLPNPSNTGEYLTYQILGKGTSTQYCGNIVVSGVPWVNLVGSEGTYQNYIQNYLYNETYRKMTQKNVAKAKYTNGSKTKVGSLKKDDQIWLPNTDDAKSAIDAWESAKQHESDVREQYEEGKATQDDVNAAKAVADSDAEMLDTLTSAGKIALYTVQGVGTYDQYVDRVLVAGVPYVGRYGVTDYDKKLDNFLLGDKYPKSSVGNVTKRVMNTGEFNYQISENGTVVATGSNQSDGSITFTPIYLGQGYMGQHSYVIDEVKGSDTSVVYDENHIGASITISMMYDGKLYAEGGYEINFTNYYK